MFYFSSVSRRVGHIHTTKGVFPVEEIKRLKFFDYKFAYTDKFSGNKKFLKKSKNFKKLKKFFEVLIF
jgi:hypothetical protein